MVDVKVAQNAGNQLIPTKGGKEQRSSCGFDSHTVHHNFYKDKRVKNTDDLNGKIKLLVQRQVDAAVSECVASVAEALTKLVDPSLSSAAYNFYQLNYDTRVAVTDAVFARLLGRAVLPGMPAELWASRTKIQVDAVMATMNAVQKMFMQNSEGYVPVEDAPTS